MYNRILKNNQVLIGNAFEVKTAYMTGGRNIHKVIEKQASTELLENPETLIEEAREEARYQAELIIKEAKLEAARIIQEVKDEALKNAEAYETEARNNGYKAGLSEGQLKYENLIKEAKIMKSKTEKEYHEFTCNIEETAVRMILDIAKKVISEEICINKDSVLMLVKQAFERCTHKENAILKVSNEDYDYIIKNKDKLLELLGGIEDLDIRKDISLTSGSCIVETLFGTVDAGVDTKLKKIQEEFERLIKTQEH